MENVLYKMKISVSDINNRLKTAEEMFNDLGYILIKSIQAKIHREKTKKEIKYIFLIFNFFYYFIF